MESAWLAICIEMLAIGALNALICRTKTAHRIAERIGFGGNPTWKE